MEVLNGKITEKWSIYVHFPARHVLLPEGILEKKHIILSNISLEPVFFVAQDDNWCLKTMTPKIDALWPPPSIEAIKELVGCTNRGTPLKRQLCRRDQWGAQCWKIHDA